jgi:hypothetical protein
MMSEHVYLFVTWNTELIHFPPHLMFYAPYATEKDLGSPPASANMAHLIKAGQPDAYIIVIPGAGEHKKE